MAYIISFMQCFIRTEEVIIAVMKLTVSIHEHLALCRYTFLNIYLKTSGHLTFQVHQLLSLSLKFLRGSVQTFSLRSCLQLPYSWYQYAPIFTHYKAQESLNLEVCNMMFLYRCMRRKCEAHIRISRKGSFYDPHWKRIL